MPAGSHTEADEAPAKNARRLSLVLFAIVVFLSAFLLFLVEPMVAKMLLPLLGGSAAVWNTCLVFFQAELLAGYAYAHAATKWLRWRALLIVQCGLALLPGLIGVLPLALPRAWTPPATTNPIPWILAALAVAVGAPFFVLSSSGPMMQRWFAVSGHDRSDDPYFLYAASNAGSMAGLLAYPLLLEPLMRLSSQSQLWSVGYISFAVLTMVCAATLWGRRPASGGREVARVPVSPRPITPTTRLRWIALAFVPSSLMLGVTTALTSDVPAIPLFWVVPLALYLLSFVLVFARQQFVAPATFNRRLPILILCAMVPGMLQTKLPLPWLLILYSLVMFSVAMVCHGELAASRPDVSGLTEFYLLISVGGVLGGIFNSIIAPLVFRSVLEFPLVLICAALLRRPVEEKAGVPVSASHKDWLLPLALGASATAALLALRGAVTQLQVLLSILIFGISGMWCLSFGRRPVRFALGVAALFLASLFYIGPYGRVIYTNRSFFGVYRVANNNLERLRYFLHGGTLHGVQSLDPARSREPLGYYTKDGPAWQVTHTMNGRLPEAKWAIIGLGAGAMACLTQPGQSLTYYEIDPMVARIAEDPRFFTLLRDCAPQHQIVIGDARLRLRDAPDASYTLIVLDAFSGDSIPMHLLTREALALYLRKLGPGGVITVHITNQYLQLAPVLGNLARDADLVSFHEDDSNVSPQQAREGKLASHWVVLARNRDDLNSLLQSSQSTAPWLPTPQSNATVWTDDYSNLLSVIRWQ